MMQKKHFILLSLLIYLFACASIEPVMNKPAIIASIESEDRTLNGNDETLLILTFSGGGTRAAALSYGVLKGLRNTPITAGKTLLDEVDIISSVSGGSFTAAYYGLFGEKIFSDYESVFLKHPIQSDLLRSWLLSPQNWGKLGGSLFNRTDLAAEYYDNTLFQGKTFAAMRKDMPTIVINATDLSTGSLFSFTSENMHWICSELASYPVSRAVAASTAVPGAFSPISLENHSGCSVSEQWQSNKDVAKLMDKARYPYLHLVDGGISDNLGVRGVLRLAQFQASNLSDLLKKYDLNRVKNVAFIIVNAADEIPPVIAQTPEEPSAAMTLSAVSTIQLKRYNRETIHQLKLQTQQWKQQGVNRCDNTNCQPIDFHVIELSFDQLPKALADKVSLYETSLELSEDQVDTLVYSGQFLLKNHRGFAAFLDALKYDGQ